MPTSATVSPPEPQSLLDDHPLLREDMEVSAAFATTVLDMWIQERGLTDDAVVEAVRGGAPLGAVLGLDPHHIEALYTQAYDLLQVGEIDAARRIIVTLLQLEPSNERAIYAMAASYQLEGDAKRAAEIYAVFVVMDATNPDGYLRVGECMLAVGDAQGAYENFQIAALEAERGNGDPAAGPKAREMMDRALAAGATAVDIL